MGTVFVRVLVSAAFLGTASLAVQAQTAGAPSAVAVAPAAAGPVEVSVRREGDTIVVADGAGKESAATLLPVTRAPPPAFDVPGAGDEVRAFEAYMTDHLWEASSAPLPADRRSTFVIGRPVPGDRAGDAAESAANWVRANPADAGLVVLAAAVGVAFPLSAVAPPTAAAGGATVPRGIVGSAMVAGPAGFVRGLSAAFLSDRAAAQRAREAIATGAGDAAAFDKVAGSFIARAAVSAGPVAVGASADLAGQRLQVSEKTAALVLKAPSFLGSLMVPPGQPYEPGGLQLNFDR